MLYSQTTSPALLNTLRALMALPELSAFRLVGGTSLALQIGHRTSVDIDLFTDKDFDSQSLQVLLARTLDSFQTIWQGKNGFSASLNGVKTDFFNWHVPFLTQPLEIDSLRLMDKSGIAAMKFDAITTRKDKKDFVDIFFLLKEFSLAEMILAFRQMYPYMDCKFVLESLSAVDMADDTNQPLMLEPLDWNDVKGKIKDDVKSYIDRVWSKSTSQQEERLKKAEELLRAKKKND